MTYRVSFLLELAVEIFYSAATIVFFQVIYSNIQGIAGWSYYEIMFLTGLDIIMSQLFVGIVFALNTNNLPETIKDGAIDFALLKPINSQFSLTISRVYLPSLISSIPGFFLLYQALIHLHVELTFINVISSLAIMLCGFIIGYSIMTMVASLAFVFTNARLFPRIGAHLILYFDNRPHHIFKNVAMRVIFFLILPAVFIASIPTTTLLRGVEVPYLIMAIFLAIMFLSFSILLWKKMIRYYSSASS